MAISLAPMREEAYGPWYDAAVRHYAEEISRSGFSEDPAAQAATQFRELLPDGLGTAGHHLFQIVEDNGTVVGELWVAERRVIQMAFVFALDIHQEYRRQGYARSAMQALEDVVKALGLHSIGLHVFGDNTGAIRLYEGLGYQVTNLNMKKELG